MQHMFDQWQMTKTIKVNIVWYVAYKVWGLGQFDRGAVVVVRDVSIDVDCHD